jgi:hypothetical protein
MADPGDGSTENALNEVERVSPMTLREKCDFLIFPLWLATIGTALLPTAAALIALSVLVVIHPPLIRQYASVLALYSAMLLIFAAILIHPVSVARKMILRRRTSGSFFPSGEELAAFRLRNQNRPSFQRIFVVGFFGLIAVAWTHEMIRTAPHHHFVIAWSFPAMMWVISIMAAVDCFRPRPERLWTGICVSGAFGTLAILYVIAALHIPERRNEFWVFPLLWGSLAVFVAILEIRRWKRRRGERRPVES